MDKEFLKFSMRTRTKIGGRIFRKEKKYCESNVRLDVGGMGTDVPQVGTVAARVGKHHPARVQGSGQAPMWRVDIGRGQVRGGGRTHRMDGNLRVGKGHHILGGVHFETPFLLCSCMRARSMCVCVCVLPPAYAPAKLFFSYVLFVLCVLRLFCVLLYFLQVCFSWQ